MSWKKFTDFLNHPIVQLFGGPGIVVVITYIVTHLRHLPVWQIWLAIIFSVGCALWIINQVDTWQDRHKKRLAKLSDKELEDTIRQWLDITTLSFKRQEPEPTLYFKFLITDDFRRNVTIVRSKKEPSMIQIISFMAFTSSGDQKVSQSNLETLADRLSLEMARLGIEFTFDGVTNPIERIRITDVVVIEDSLTGFYFRQRILFVIRALVLIGQVAKDTVKEKGITLSTSHKEGSQT